MQCARTVFIFAALKLPKCCATLIRSAVRPHPSLSLSLFILPCVAGIYKGEYAGFDVNQPTSRTGGKGEAINIIRRSIDSNANITMIGDGATDLEASPPANNFIGYGGNVIREEVRNRAPYYVINFEQLVEHS